MRSAYFCDYIRNLALAFYRSILKLSINAHQLVAYWRSRINTRNQQSDTQTTTSDVELKHQIRTTTNESKSLDSAQTLNYTAPATSQQSGLSIKTPKTRSKLHSLLRRLSIRNFMEYCVIALNEASSSSCSNKLDLSSCDKPVWLLGQLYELPQEAEKLVDDIRSKLWITYRRNFPPIDESTRYTTDRGFGCMIRCGQMVLANALLYKNLGRDWRWSPDGFEANPDIYAKILKLFQDKLECPYSIHNIVRTGQQEGKNIGEWFGPNTIAQALKRMAMAESMVEKVNNEVLISIDAALDNVVVVDEIKSKFKQATNNFKQAVSKSTSERSIETGVEVVENFEPTQVDNGSESISCDANRTSTQDQWLPGILFIQLRLGLTKINPLYFNALRKTFQFKSSLGIIGGRPNHALYLIGYTEDDIIYLDPHSTQQYIDLDTGETSERSSSEDIKPSPVDSTYHCACPERMSIDRLDPSLALCFYFHTETEFDEWCGLSNDLLIKSEQAPMFEIAQYRPSGWNIPLASTTVKSTFESPSCDRNNKSKNNKSGGATGKNESSNRQEEKFIVLKEVSDRGDIPVDDSSYDSNRIDKSPSDNSQANDDEEFEMLG